ncbi:hypothetical protein SEUCBS139899_007864 [Sporothrix eucalyptigena]
MRRVLATSDPKEQKRLGKQVEAPPRTGGRLKLMATDDKLLVEAASQNRVWGTGYTEGHAMSFRDHWDENRLGLV